MKYISRQKLNELEKELGELKIKRNLIAKRIHAAQDIGDLSENAEYIEAKESQAFNEGKIQELEQVIRQAIIISKKRNCSAVEIGCQVIVKNKNNKQEFIIVGSQEADPSKGKISNESPLGRAFLNKKKDDEVIVQTPRGKVHYKILQIK